MAERRCLRALLAVSLLAGLSFALVPSAKPASAQSAGVVYLTFDDGPSAYTSSVLDVLNRYGAKATFFVIGQQVGARAATMRAIADERPRDRQPHVEPPRPAARSPTRRSGTS